MTYPVQKSDDEWRNHLTARGAEPGAFQITRRAATERPYTGRYEQHWEAGRYQCICCGQALFEAGTKFDAGCGWPSYHTAAGADVIERIVDRTHGMVRVEVRCRNCGSHLGHVFPDGPEPTGERYCINSAAIDFAPNDSGETRL